MRAFYDQPCYEALKVRTLEAMQWKRGDAELAPSGHGVN
jgi:hypothetical protein